MEKTRKSLRIGTYNIRNVTDHYHLRIPLLRSAFSQMNVDVCGFQEVSFNTNNQLNDFHNKEEYHHFMAETQLNYAKVNNVNDIDDKFNIDGNAVMVKKDLVGDKDEFSHKVLHISAVRAVHMVSFVYESKLKVNVINVHLHHVVEEELIRVQQMKSVLKWIEFNTNFKDDEDYLTIILGDFNAQPNSDTYNLIQNSGYASSFNLANGEEPIRTFHNKMDAPFKDDDEEGTYDYIL
jgi:endonuclease/exonuclease/phosphatase family metal-dependent hydrolase